MSSQQRSDLRFMQRAVEIRIATLEHPLSYKKLGQFEHGFEFEILQNFALDYGYKLKVKSFRNRKEVLKKLKSHQADIGLGRFSELMTEVKSLTHSDPYDFGKTSLLCRQEINVETNADASLSQNNQWRLMVNPQIGESKWLGHITTQAKNLKIIFNANASSESLLTALKNNQADCSLLNSLEAQYFRKVVPSLKIAKEISHHHNFFLMINNPMVLSDFNHWLQQSSKRSLITQIRQSYSGSTGELRKNDYSSLAKAREEVLPQFFEQFQKHAIKFGIPWQLMAAIAYQESHWNPEAISFTGVRGIMQITKETAEFLGIDDREDSEQSIFAAYKYLKILLERTPKYLPSIERLSLALATYNVGPAHMIDAQNLAIKMGKNPYSWQELKNVLPLLSMDAFQDQLKYGRARGEEPVQFVNRVLSYFDILKVQI